MIVRAAAPDHLPWLAERAGLAIHPALRAIEAVDDAGRIHGMVGFDGWTKNAVCLHVALDNPAALRHLLKPGFGIPFIELGLGVALAPVASTNDRSLKLVPKLGFRFAYRVRDGLDKGVDLIWFEMRKEECRHIRQGAR